MTSRAWCRAVELRSEAAEAGNLEKVNLLLDAGANINREPANKGGPTALQAAAAAGELNIVVLLFNGGAKVNAEPATEKGQTALEAAASAGNALKSVTWK
jgi:ankyrin repeat protein